MYEDDDDQRKNESASSPKDKANEKSAEFRMHAELAAVFEATRKFDAEIHPKLDATLAREIQKKIGTLEKNKITDTPIVQETHWPVASELLTIPKTNNLPTNDYHLSRRPGEVLIIRWLEGEQVDSFYNRLQAHFDAAMNHFRNDEKENLGWKQEAGTEEYLNALDEIKVDMAERYLRPMIKEHRFFVLSTQTADEINISYLTDTIMGASAAEIVGDASAPPDDPTDSDLAWFFKLFSLRGIVEGVERMCFFTYLQKSDESF